MPMLGMPPVPPPLGAPTLSNSMAGGEGPKNAGGIPSLFYGIEQQLKQIAFVLPGSAGQINDMIDELRSIMVESLSGSGPSPAGNPPGMGGITSPTEEMKSGY